jgi:hypothetical protein
MKVDPAHHQKADRKESRNVYRQDKSVFDTGSPFKQPSRPAASESAFSKILEENRRDDAKKSVPVGGSEVGDGDSLVEKKREDRLEKSRVNPEEHHRDGGSNDGQTGSNPDDGQSQSSAALLTETSGASSNDSAPAARSILHVADLERMVAFIRSETFRDRKEILIALQNSILKGLNIRLSLRADGSLSAEFRSKDFSTRGKLEKRRSELEKILENRVRKIVAVSVADETET